RRRHTRWPRDWSSDVCSSDLRGDGLTGASAEATVRHDDVPPETTITGGPSSPTAAATATFSFTGDDDVTSAGDLRFAWRLDGWRSEERRVGKECGSGGGRAAV